jgi:hypothetical protein
MPECTCFPHGPDEPCTCDGYAASPPNPPGTKCTCWPGHVVGCTCDIEWDCPHRQTY